MGALVADDLTLVLEDATSGKRMVVPLTEIGGTLRFAVGERGRRSSVWRVWANTTTHDVYIASRTIAGIQKFSLHASGDWRYAFTSQFMATEAGAAWPDRVLDRWQRPEPNEHGHILGPVIIVRAEDVTEMDDAALKGEIDWVPAPPAGEAVWIQTVFLQPDRWVSLPRGALPVGLLRLANDEGLFVAAEKAAVSDQQRATLAHKRSEAEARVPEAARRAGEPGLRFAVFGFDKDGRRFVWDTAF